MVSVVALLLVALVSTTTVEAAGATDRTQTPTRSQMPLIVVRSLGPVDSWVLRLACRSLLDHYPVRCAIRSTRGVFDYAPSFDHRREQLDARSTLERVFRTKAADAVVELDITPLDLYEARKPYVFGLASLTDRVALVSLARIRSDRSRLRQRLSRLVLHEVGHALGLPHHDDAGCVMRQDATPRSLDYAPERPCDACHTVLAEHAAVLSRPGQIAYDRAVGFLARGEVNAARASFDGAALDGTLGDGLLTAFGIAFLRAGRHDQAIEILHRAVAFDARPETHASLAFALQRRGGAADIGRAIYHFERAIDMRPGWAHLASHVAVLRTSAPASAQGPR